MTETALPETPASPSPKATPPLGPTTSARKLGNPWMLAAVLCAGVAGWQWYAARQQLSSQQTHWEKQSEQANLEERQQLKQTLEQNTALQTRLAAIESKQATFEEQSTSLLSAYREFSAHRDMALLAEAEHELVLAAQQVQATGDPSPALRALQVEDQRFAQIEKSSFTQVRKAFARDLEQLKKVPALDRNGMAQRLETMVANIDLLPLEMDARPAPATLKHPTDAVPETWWSGFLQHAWLQVKDLIRIERMDQSHPVLLPADQRFFVQENIKLRLLSARVALQTRDATAFKHSLDAAINLLSSHFNQADKGVQTQLATLRQMAGTPIAHELPTLSESLSALRQAASSVEKKSKP